MMRGLSVKQWATLHGVAYSNEKTGFCRYTTRIVYRKRVLLLPNQRYPFGPSLREALKDLVSRAHGAYVMGGEFEVYFARQTPGRSLGEYEEEFRPMLSALETLEEFFGKRVANDLMRRVKW